MICFLPLPVPVGTRTRLAAEIRRDIGYCEQRKRKDYAAHDDKGGSGRHTAALSCGGGSTRARTTGPGGTPPKHWAKVGAHKLYR